MLKLDYEHLLQGIGDVYYQNESASKLHISKTMMLSLHLKRFLTASNALAVLGITLMMVTETFLKISLKIAGVAEIFAETLAKTFEETFVETFADICRDRV